jgi:fused signal recognition particle receptor
MKSLSKPKNAVNCEETLMSFRHSWIRSALLTTLLISLAACTSQAARDAEFAEQEAARVAAEQEAARLVAEQERQRAEALRRQQEVQAAERARLQAQREQAEADARARAEAERREREAAERRERERLAAIAAAEAERQQKLDRISQLEAQIAAAETRTVSDEERSLVLQQAILAAEDLLEALSAEQAKYENTDAAGNTVEPLAKDMIADLQARKDSLVEQARAQ